MLKPCDTTVTCKTKAYLTLIRPQLEYASAAWNPHDNKSVNKLEQVQKNAARFVTGNYHWSTSSSGLVSSLGWCTLEQRRLLMPCCFSNFITSWSALRFHLNWFSDINASVNSSSAHPPPGAIVGHFPKLSIPGSGIRLPYMVWSCTCVRNAPINSGCYHPTPGDLCFFFRGTTNSPPPSCQKLQKKTIYSSAKRSFDRYGRFNFNDPETTRLRSIKHCDFRSTKICAFCEEIPFLVWRTALY